MKAFFVDWGAPWHPSLNPIRYWPFGLVTPLAPSQITNDAPCHLSAGTKAGKDVASFGAEKVAVGTVDHAPSARPGTAAHDFSVAEQHG